MLWCSLENNFKETPDHLSDTASHHLMVLHPHLRACFRSLFWYNRGPHRLLSQQRLNRRAITLWALKKALANHNGSVPLLHKPKGSTTKLSWCSR